jgi:RNA polymerase sigma factor (sigma-70 family)
VTDENDPPEDREAPADHALPADPGLPGSPGLPGDPDLPAQMVREHWRRVCAWVRRADRRQRLGSPLDDGAIAAEVFEKALTMWRETGPADRPPRDKWIPWLWTITNYKIHEAIRARNRLERTVGELHANPVPAQNHVRDPAKDAVSREFLENVYKCIQELGEPDKSLLPLVWSGWTVAEAAAELGLTRPAAGMRMTRINRFLKDEGGFAAPTDAMKALRAAIERGKHD